MSKKGFDVFHGNNCLEIDIFDMGMEGEALVDDNTEVGNLIETEMVDVEK